MHPGSQTAVKSDHFQGNSDLPFHRAVPSCRASEVALIGSLMLSASNEQAFLDLKSRTRPEWFFYPDCRAVAEAIEKLHRDGKPVDAVVLQAAMADAGVKVETGGVGFLAECLQSVPDYHNGAAYADVVREKARLRACLTVGGEIVQASQGTNPSADDICVKAIDRLVRIQSQGNMATVQPIDRLADEVYSDMERKQPPLLTTGYTMLDREVSGLGEGETVVVAARPSMGKGILRNGMMLGMARAGIPVCIISLEDRKKKILRNMLSALSNVENGKLRTGFSCMTPDEIERVRDAVGVISKLPITIIDDAFSVGEVCAAISGAVARHGCKVVSIDYLQLIEPEWDGGHVGREQQVASVSRRMVQTCRRLGYRQVMLAQINRSVESTWKASPKTPVPPAPTMAMLRESGQIEQDADGILFIHRPDYYLSEHAKATGLNVEYSNTAEIHIAKWKDAERNKIVRLHSAMQFQRFDDCGPDDMSLGDWSNAKAADTPANRIGKVEACGDFSLN